MLMLAKPAVFPLSILILVLALVSIVDGAEPIQLGTRRELFVDYDVVDKAEGKISLKLHQPVPREIALKFDRPWEGNASGYPTVIQDGDLYRMYYRGHRYILDPPPLRQAQPEVVCYAESRDGINWIRPNLGLHTWPQTTENNIIWRDSYETHNFAPFKDSNPNCKPDERFKAVGGTIASKGLWTFKSADGIRWSRLSDAAVVTSGAFDSHNTVFWDDAHQRYTMYIRYFSEDEFKGLRSIGVSYSTDFQTWTAPVGLTYSDSHPQQMYTNQVAPYYRAPHVLFGFPTRYVARPLSNHAKHLEPIKTRAQFALSIADSGTYSGAEVTDGVFMSSRDGQSFHRWSEAFLRPGPESEGRWIYGDNYQSYGLFETAGNDPGMPREISFHFNEGAWRDDMHRLRRYSIRLDGFVSLNALLDGGDLTTKPVIFRGNKLTVNYSTSAMGSLRVEIQDENGNPLPGYSMTESDELFGDNVAQTITWQDKSDVANVAGRAIRLKFHLADGDLYSFQFQE